LIFIVKILTDTLFSLPEEFLDKECFSVKDSISDGPVCCHENFIKIDKPEVPKSPEGPEGTP
jgi:hypothetical protein